MTRMHSTVVARPLTGRNYCSDNELMTEVLEAIMQEVGDVRVDSGVADHMRNQISVRLEDGRRMRMTFMFE